MPTLQIMRWSDLFADLEAQLQASDRALLTAQVAEGTRRERASVSWADRASTCTGEPLTVHTPAGRVRGTLQDLGSDWLLLEEQARGSAIVPFTAVLSVVGLPRHSDDSRGYGRRFGVGVALRAIARDRGPVVLLDTHGAVVTGTIDMVGADHLDIAEHPADAVRRRSAVTGFRAVPFSSLAIVRRG